MKVFLTWFIILSTLGGGGYFIARKFSGSKPSDTGPAGRSARASTAIVSARSISFAITAAGEITPAEKVSVRPEISGRIETMPVDIGDKVKKDALLFALDDQDLQTEKEQRQIEIQGSTLQVNASRLAAEKMELAFKRIQELRKSNLVSQEVFDNARLEFDVAKNALEIAENNLERTRKALQLVQDKLDKTKILAPFDCTILTRPVSIGQAVSGASGVNSGTEVLTIADLGELNINAHINQADVTRMTVGQSVEIEVEAVAGLKLIGRIDLVAPEATIRNGIKGFATRIIVKNDENSGVRPGMTANLIIPLQGADNVLAIPLAAVFTDQGDRFAYVRQGDKFERRPIRIGVTDYDFAEVASGLQSGETVSLVTPQEEAGKAQQAFGAAGKAGRGAAAGGPRGEGRSGGEGRSAGGPRGGETRAAGSASAAGNPPAPTSGTERRGPGGERPRGGERRRAPSDS